MNKNIFKLSFTFIAFLMLWACNNDIEDKFDKTATDRMNERTEMFRKILTDAPNGWAMEYYPGGKKQEFGGFMLTVEFGNDGFATFHSVEAKSKEESSRGMYSIKQDVGPTLNFNTGNKLLHYFSNPKTPEGYGIGKGFLGDFEFQMIEGSADHIVMKGKRHRSTIHLYKLDSPVKEYIAKVQKFKQTYSSIAGIKEVNGTLGDKTIAVNMVRRQNFTIIVDNNEYKMPFMFTEDKIKLYEPIEIEGKSIEHLNWNSKDFTMTNSEANLTINIVPAEKGVLLENLIGNYKLLANYDNKKKDYNIKIDVSIENNAIYGLQLIGIPNFPIKLFYDDKEGALRIKPQTIVEDPDVKLCVWDTNIGSLSWSTDYSLMGEWQNDIKDNFVLKFIDGGNDWVSNGEKLNANALILWDVQKGTAYSAYQPFERLYDIHLVKK